MRERWKRLREEEERLRKCVADDGVAGCPSTDHRGWHCSIPYDHVHPYHVAFSGTRFCAKWRREETEVRGQGATR
jgi:hypothetical protein